MFEAVAGLETSRAPLAAHDLPRIGGAKVNRKRAGDGMALWTSGLPGILLAIQGAGGSISGTVSDGETGAPLPGAVVFLPDLGRGNISDSSGRYGLVGITAGSWRLEARRAGYAPRAFQVLVPHDGTLAINIVLRPAPVILQAIEVRATAPAEGDGNIDHPSLPDRRLNLADLRRHPLLPEPDALLATAGGDIGQSPESPSGLSIRGGLSDQVGYTVDGIPVLNPYHSGGSFTAWNPDALSQLDLFTTSPPPEVPEALSGVVSARTREPGSRPRGRGSLSTTQIRVTVDGPLNRRGAGYLLSLRSVFPGLLAHEEEPSYLNGSAGDWLAKVESPLVGGRLRLLGFGNGNEMGAAASVPGGAGVPAPRNALEWNSRSLGAEWTRRDGNRLLRLRSWSALGDAGAVWHGSDSSQYRLASSRRDVGAVASVSLVTGTAGTTVGFRVEHSRTAYRLESVTGDAPSMGLHAGRPAWAAFLAHRRFIAARSEVELTAVGSAAAGGVHLSPGAWLHWRPASTTVVSGGYSRRHQFAQSLRNPESVVSNIFPAELHLSAGDAGVPVARSDLWVIALDYRPTAELNLAVRAYARNFDGLALVAPRTPHPFATGEFTQGGGRAAGATIEAAATRPGYRLLASYGFQRVRLEYGDSSYVPAYGATHAIHAGVTVLPQPGSTIRLGLTGVLGRRTSAVEDPFEWEGCNLGDRGCEFVGGRSQPTEPPGSTRLPAYLRLDLGLRQHWPIRIAGKEGLLAVFGTVTNLMNRRNVLTVAVDPTSGIRRRVEMRPRSPLVVGIDWEF